MEFLEILKQVEWSALGSCGILIACIINIVINKQVSKKTISPKEVLSQATGETLKKVKRINDKAYKKIRNIQNKFNKKYKGVIQCVVEQNETEQSLED